MDREIKVAACLEEVEEEVEEERLKREREREVEERRRSEGRKAQSGNSRCARNNYAFTIHTAFIQQFQLA